MEPCCHVLDRIVLVNTLPCAVRKENPHDTAVHTMFCVLDHLGRGSELSCFCYVFVPTTGCEIMSFGGIYYKVIHFVY